MIKMVLNNNFVIKMQIIASQLSTVHSFFIVRSHFVCACEFIFCSKKMRVAISKKDLLQNAFHAYRDAMWHWFVWVFFLSTSSSLSDFTCFAIVRMQVAIVVTFTTILFE